jgi:hypothetical protein
MKRGNISIMLPRGWRVVADAQNAVAAPRVRRQPIRVSSARAPNMGFDYPTKSRNRKLFVEWRNLNIENALIVQILEVLLKSLQGGNRVAWDFWRLRFQLGLSNIRGVCEHPGNVFASMGRTEEYNAESRVERCAMNVFEGLWSSDQRLLHDNTTQAMCDEDSFAANLCETSVFVQNER